jgi:sigma-B regulation protein RsbU (phosphoserine phosphatase)
MTLSADPVATGSAPQTRADLDPTKDNPMADEGIVLLVEDDPDLGNFLRTALQRRSDRPVRLAVNGPEALQILADEAVDVLVTDIQMPGMSGLDLVGEIRKTQPALPIVMMTAHASFDYAVGALRHQVDEFLEKPISAAELVPKVRQLAERGSAARRTARVLADIDPAIAEAAEVTRLERQMLRDLATVMGEQTSLSQQLERAAQVQRDLLPRNAPNLPGYDFAGTCVPSFAVGGDFYDWVESDQGVDFTVADVMGKGIPAAIVTATVRAVMRGIERADGPASALRSAAASLRHDLEVTGTFVTVFHGRLHGATGTVSFADAGHGLTLHVHADGTFSRLGSDDLPLGVTRDATWTQQAVTLNPGDTLVSFSDGLFDLLGGTTAALTDVATMVTTSTSCTHLMQRVTTLAAQEKALIDDVTVVAIHRAATPGVSG